MSRFRVKRSLKQLYIEKHAVECMITIKKADMDINGYEPTVRQVADLQSEEAFLNEILNDIKNAEQVVKREIADL